MASCKPRWVLHCRKIASNSQQLEWQFTGGWHLSINSFWKGSDLLLLTLSVVLKHKNPRSNPYICVSWLRLLIARSHEHVWPYCWGIHHLSVGRSLSTGYKLPCTSIVGSLFSDYYGNPSGDNRSLCLLLDWSTTHMLFHIRVHDNVMTFTKIWI